MSSVPDLETLRKELEILQKDQDESMTHAVYTGITVGQAKELDRRRRRINELYEELLARSKAT
jgi:hypothetical protein